MLFELKQKPPKCPLFVELCAGLGAVSLVLQGGLDARPPVSRMGNKYGYAEAILGAVGLRPSDGAAGFLWCEPDDGARALLMSYPDPKLRTEAAEVIRGWKDEEPRALWERLRAEGPIRGVDGREVARWITVGQLSYRQMEPASGFNPGMASDAGSAKCWRPGLSRVSEMLNASRPQWPSVTITDDARSLDPPLLPPGSVVLMDPPYQDTTGYAHNLPRDEVLTLARRWDDAGATVILCEAAPLGAEVYDGISDADPGPLEGWHSYEITGTRKGQKRTFSKQQREWITMSQPADKLWAAGLALTNQKARLSTSQTEPSEQHSLF